MKLVHLVILMIINLSSFSQNYGDCYLAAYRASLKLYAGEYSSALKGYREIINNFPNAYTAYYEYGILLYKEKDFKNCASNLTRMAELGYHINELLQEDYGNGFSFSIEELSKLKVMVSEFENDYNKLYNKTVSSYNYEYNIELIKIKQRDQLVRTSWPEIDSICETQYKINRSNLIEQQDSLNLLRIRYLVNKYGMPSYKLVSYEAILGFQLCIAHVASKKWCYSYCDSLLNNIKGQFNLEFFISPQVYANIIDKRENAMNQRNYYCQLFDRDNKIFDPLNLDSRRKQIFLPPIKEVRPKLKVQ